MALYIGLMSGTSMDGVDAALIETTTQHCIAGLTKPYSQEARAFLDKVLTAQCVELGELNQLSTVLGKEFAQAVLALLENTPYSAKDVTAIGSHGQTICHDATASIPYTVQLGCPHTITEITGIPVVADFRTRDLVVGGKGAPFAPLYHQVLFGQQSSPLAIVNIGGIANVTFLEGACPPRGYDTGPGNCLMDAWINQVRHLSYDANGDWASSGHVIPSLLSTMLADPYFQQPSPKSLGKEYFSTEWLSSQLTHHEQPVDVQATLLALTAKTIAQAILTYPNPLSQVILCGGGVHNRALHQAIQQELDPIEVLSSAALGVNPDFIEAMMFAWLAEQAINQTPLDLNALTGAKKPVILGVVYPIK